MKAVAHDAYSLDVLFSALADPTRRKIVERLAHGSASVAELARPFSLSQPAISKHLKVLERAGIVSTGRAAQRRPRRLERGALQQLSRWIETYKRALEESYGRLDDYLHTLQEKEETDERA